MKYVHSLLNYLGSKYSLLNKIIPSFKQPISTFVDLFAGGLNISLNVEAETIIANDINPYLIEMYELFYKTDKQILLDKINKIVYDYGLNYKNEKGYYELREHFNSNRNIIELFVLIRFAFNYMLRMSNNNFNSAFGRVKKNWNSKTQKDFMEFIDALQSKNFKFYNKDFTQIDLLNILDKNSLVYCDPPYFNTNCYNNKWNEEQDKNLFNLLDKLNEKGIRFAYSNLFEYKGKENKLLKEWSKNYFINYIDKNYQVFRNIKEGSTKFSNCVEVFITNYEYSIGNQSLENLF